MSNAKFTSNKFFMRLYESKHAAISNRNEIDFYPNSLMPKTLLQKTQLSNKAAGNCFNRRLIFITIMSPFSMFKTILSNSNVIRKKLREHPTLQRIPTLKDPKNFKPACTKYQYSGYDYWIGVSSSRNKCPTKQGSYAAHDCLDPNS